MRKQQQQMRSQRSCGNLQPSIAEAIKKVLHHGYSNSTIVCQTERAAKASPPKAKTSRNQLSRTRSLTQQQVLQTASKPQPSFSQVLKPMVSQPQILSKQRSIDFSHTQQDVLSPDFMDRLFSKRVQNVSVDLSKARKKSEEAGAPKTCRINFIEHNKQRIKLMSANSRSRVALTQTLTSEQDLSSSRTRRVQPKTANLSRNNKTAALLTGCAKKQQESSASTTLNMSFTTSKPAVKVLESSTNKHVN